MSSPHKYKLMPTMARIMKKRQTQQVLTISKICATSFCWMRSLAWTTSCKASAFSHSRTAWLPPSTNSQCMPLITQVSQQSRCGFSQLDGPFEVLLQLATGTDGGNRHIKESTNQEIRGSSWVGSCEICGEGDRVCEQLACRAKDPKEVEQEGQHRAVYKESLEQWEI